MDYSNIKKEFIEKLSLHLNQDGFKYIKSEYAFRRKTSWGFQEFSLLYNRGYGFSFEIDPCIGIRFDAIERIYTETAIHTPTPTDKRNSMSILSGLAHFEEDKGSFDYRFEIVTAEDIPKAVDHFLDLYNRLVIPIFEKYSSIEAYHELINTDPLKDVRIANNIWRGQRGVIVAHLLNDPRLFDLIEKYAEEIKSAYNGFYKGDYDLVVQNILQKRGITKSIEE